VDVITQALAGAMVAQMAARPAQARLAAGIGAFAGLLADADVFIRSPDDALLSLEYHRQFTHSIFFIPFGGLIAALLLWLFVRRHLPFARLYAFTLLGYLPSGLIDACTSYGTQLLWPLSDARIDWSVIAIVDPVFTGVLAVAVAWSAIKRTPMPARIGLALALLYLLLGMVQRDRAEGVALALAQARGHVPTRLEAKPTLGNLVLWRVLYEAEGRFYVDAVRAGFFNAPRTYVGGSVARFSADELAGLQPDSVLARDIERFTWFSQGFVARHPDRPDILGDVRYAMLPNDLVPLWGIEMDLAQQDRHVEFITFRRTDRATRQAFWAMLWGDDVDM
jgi:inner membrane protein